MELVDADDEFRKEGAMVDAGTLNMTELQTAGRFVASAPILPGRHTLLRRYLNVWQLPEVLRFITGTLTNHRLSTLTREQAGEVYAVLSPCLASLHQFLASAKGAPQNPLLRVLLRGVHAEGGAQTERIEDILEALAWAADPELAGFLDRAISQIPANG